MAERPERPTAYLLGFIDTTKTPPVMVAAGVYGQPAGCTTTELRKRFAVDIGQVSADTFGEAMEMMENFLATLPQYEWLRVLNVARAIEQMDNGNG